MACINKQKHQQGKEGQVLTQPMNFEEDFSNSPERIRQCHIGKANQIVTPTTRLIPRCLDLAVYRSANRAKTSGSTDEELNAESGITNEKPNGRGVHNLMCESHHLENNIRNNLSVGNSLQMMKEKQHNSKTHSGERFGCNDTLKNKLGYVVPVLPLPRSGEKSKYIPVMQRFCTIALSCVAISFVEVKIYRKMFSLLNWGDLLSWSLVSLLRTECNE